MSYLLDELKRKKQAETDETIDKILLMGLQEAGKTAIKDVVFFDKDPEEVVEYMATTHYQRQIIGDKKKNLLIDSGGQETYWNEAVTYFRYLIFSNAKILIWVVDLTHPELFEESERRFSFTIRQFKKENKEGKVYVFCHKADVVEPEKLDVVVEHVKELLSDPKFEIEFKITSIFKKNQLKQIMNKILEESSIDQEQIELVTDVEKKIEESPEFVKFLEEHKADPRVKELMEYIKPQPKQYLPSFGKVEVDVNLENYGIIEIIILDKETLKPAIGASSHIISNKKQSFEYILALNYFKNLIKSKEQKIEALGSTFSYPEGEVHALIFNLKNSYIIITSFNEIDENIKKELYKFILKFSDEMVKEKSLVKEESISKPPSIATEQSVEIEQSIAQEVKKDEKKVFAEEVSSTQKETLVKEDEEQKQIIKQVSSEKAKLEEKKNGVGLDITEKDITKIAKFLYNQLDKEKKEK